MLFSDLVPFYSKDSLYGSVVEDCEFVEVVFCEVPRFTAPEEGVKGSRYVDLGFDSFIHVFVIKEVFCGPHEGFGFPYSGFYFDVFVEEGCDYAAKVFKLVHEVYVFIVGQEEFFREDVVVEVLFCLFKARGEKHGFRF